MTDIKAIKASPGPFANEDGDIWLPVDAWTWNGARHEAASAAFDEGAWIRSRYVGKAMAHCCEGEGWEGCDNETHDRLAYHFRTYEGTFR